MMTSGGLAIRHRGDARRLVGWREAPNPARVHLGTERGDADRGRDVMAGGQVAAASRVSGASPTMKRTPAITASRRRWAMEVGPGSVREPEPDMVAVPNAGRRRRARCGSSGGRAAGVVADDLARGRVRRRRFETEASSRPDTLAADGPDVEPDTRARLVAELRPARLTGVRFKVPVETMSAKLANLPDGVSVERRIEVRFDGAEDALARLYTLVQALGNNLGRFQALVGR